MSEINYEKFLADLVKPLVVYPDEVMVKIFSEENDVIIKPTEKWKKRKKESKSFTILCSGA